MPAPVRVAVDDGRQSRTVVATRAAGAFGGPSLTRHVLAGPG